MWPFSTCLTYVRISYKLAQIAIDWIHLALYKSACKWHSCSAHITYVTCAQFAHFSHRTISSHFAHFDKFDISDIFSSNRTLCTNLISCYIHELYRSSCRHLKHMPNLIWFDFLHKLIFNLIRELYRKCRKRAFQTHFRHAIATFLITFSCEFRAVCGHFGIKSSYIIRHASLFDKCEDLGPFCRKLVHKVHIANCI